MDDEDRKVTDLLARTEEVRQAVDRRVGDMDCPACGVDDWEPVPGFAGLWVLFPLESGTPGGEHFDTSFLAVAYTCVACGYVRMHHFRDRMLD